MAGVLRAVVVVAVAVVAKAAAAADHTMVALSAALVLRLAESPQSGVG